jgi:hypothetical protein
MGRVWVMLVEEVAVVVRLTLAEAAVIENNSLLFYLCHMMTWNFMT